MVFTIRSLGLHGVSGYSVSAECDLSSGLPAFNMVGYRVHTGYTSKKAEPLHGWRGSAYFYS